MTLSSSPASRFPPQLLLVALAVVVTGGAIWAFAKRQEAASRNASEVMLTQLADWKASELAHWIKERRGDATVGCQSLRVQRLLAAPHDSAARAATLQYFRDLLQAYDYENVALFDGRGDLLLAASTDRLQEHRCVPAHVDAGLRSPEVIVNDLHRGQPDGPIDLSLACPIRLTARGNGPADGVLLLLVNPQQFLFSFVQRWPVPSPSGEILLVRRDGEEMVCLNETRHHRDAALTLRSPMTQTQIVTVQAGLGARGLMQGRDYRDVPVFGVAREAAGTPWLVVAKVDQAEISAPVLREAWTTGTAFGLGWLAVLLGMGVVARQRRVRFMQQELSGRQRAEAALRESQERFRTVIENSQDGINLLDLQTGRYILMSPSQVAMTGFTREEINNISAPEAFERVHPDDRQIPVEQQKQVAEGSAAGVTVEYRWKVKSGEYRWFSDSRGLVRDAQGKAVALVGVSRDITERKRAEEALRHRLELQDQLAKVAATVPGVICSFKLSPAGQASMPFATSAFRDLYGLQPDEVREDFSPALARVHPEDRGRLQQGIAESARTMTPWADTFRVHHPQKGERWLQGHSVPRREPDGSVLWHGFVQDVTERQQAVETLQQSEARFKALFEQAAVGVAEVESVTGQFLRVNQRYCDITGYTREEMLQLDFQTLTHPDDLAADLAQMGQLLAGTIDEFSMEKRYYRKDGSLVWVMLTVSPLWSPGAPRTKHVAVVQDITERKQAEVALARTRNTLVEAQGIAHLGSFEYVAATRTTVWSDEEYRIYGLDSDRPSPTYDEMLARCIHPDDAALLHETFTNAMQSSSVYEFEHRIVRPDGSVRWVHDRAQPYFDPHGNLVRYVGTTLDITERKQADQAVRESEARRALALDAAQAGTWEWDLATGRNLWSDELWKLYALEPHSCEPSYEAWRQSVHPEGRERVEQELQSLVQQEAELNLEWRVNSPDNSTRWLMSRGRPLRDASGRVIRYLGVVMDITARKRAEEAARQSARRLNFALTASHTGAWSLNLQDHTATRTLIHAQIFGYPNAEAAWSADKFLSHVVPEDRERVRQCIQAGIAARSRWSLECRIRRADDQIRWVFIAGGFEHSGPSAGISGIIQDITERKRLEQERAALEAQLRHQQKLESIGTLASGVAHEINNPLTGILNYAQLIQDRLPGDSPLAEFTGEIMHETQRVATIVRNLLTFARNEKQSHSPARIADIVEAVLSLVRAVIRRDQITLLVNVPQDLPQLKCRSQQIQQVIMNLVTNARDALNERYPGHHPDKQLRLEAQLLERAGRRWIRLTVQDRGTGIPPEVRERMFDPFFTTKGRDKGTGLGLSISHGIVKDHHGQWTVESEPGQFTRMHVDLPVDNGWRI